MKSLLLLILSLMAGCEASSSKVKGCIGGWVIFTCNNKRNTNITVDTPTQETILSTEEDVWQDQGRFSVYHDTQNKKVRLAIRNIQDEDFGKFKFYEEFHSNNEIEESDSGSKEDKKPGSKKGKKKIEFEIVDANCQTLDYQTAYRTAKTTIPCDYNPRRDKSRVKLFCKDSSLICEDILSTKSPLKSNGTFTLTETISGFNVSISKVSSQHAGLYWCGLELNKERYTYQYAFRKIQLEVEDITNVTESPTAGQNLTYWCRYPLSAYNEKFICKGEDPSICEPLVRTLANKMNTEKFSLKEDRPRRNITVTVKNVSTEDTGTYWCGAEHINKTRRFFHKLEMKVVPLTQSRFGGWGLFPVTVAVLICVALLLPILVLAYKRFQRPQIIGEEQKNEERAYEDIQERPQKPGSGTAPKTIYVTANAPTNPTAPQYYSTINSVSGSKGDGSHMYSTVRDNSQCPVYSTVNPAFRPSEDHFYSTVNMPQQQ